MKLCGNAIMCILGIIMCIIIFVRKEVPTMVYGQLGLI